MEDPQRRQLLISRGWIQAVVLVVPRRVVDPQGRVVFTGGDVKKGQQVFLHNGLMEYGSAFGHGAYLGPDFTADYLRRASDHVKRAYGGPASDSAARRTIEDFRTNRYVVKPGTLTRSPARRPRRSAPLCRTTAASSPTPRPSTACARGRSRITLSCAS